jgi:D-serine deaminase-like pyridoxal phosphate-dependent protein
MRPGTHWTELDTPTLLIDLDPLERNIHHMVGLAERHGLALRPHAKTHKSVAIAERQVAAGARGLTVAKLGEAETFAVAGFVDLFVANQLVTDAKLERAARLLRDGARLTFGVDSAEGVSAAARVARRRGVTFRLVIEIDSGLQRCGVAPPAAVELARALAAERGVALAGVFTHAGHSYAARSPEDLERAAAEEAGAVVEAAQAISRIGLEVEVLSVGSTPTAERVAAEPGITELRPGNYVFYDATQVSLGVIGIGDCSLSVAATVISRPAPNRAVIDAGAKTLGLDRGAHGI